MKPGDMAVAYAYVSDTEKDIRFKPNIVEKIKEICRVVQEILFKAL